MQSIKYQMHCTTCTVGPASVVNAEPSSSDGSRSLSLPALRPLIHLNLRMFSFLSRSLSPAE